MESNGKLKVGFMSGLYYGSDGYRRGLWELAADVFRKEKVNFIVLVGGLIDFKGMRSKLDPLLKGAKKDERAAVREKFLKDTAKYLAENIPAVRGVKIYVITSPAYEGWIGEEVARRLVKLREDILLYREGGDRLELQQIGKVLGVYAPKKGVWMRGDYYDTPGLRVLKDEKKRSTRGIGDINVVGCLASSVFHPGDSTEIKRPYFLIPVLYKITDTRTAENQVGVSVLEFNSPHPKEATAKIYDFKDFVSDEWAFVAPPAGTTKLEQKVIDTINTHGPCTVGMMHDFSGLERPEIGKAIGALMDRKPGSNWPGMYQDESKRFSFRNEWFQEQLRYKEPKGEIVTDSIAGFGCLHAGCRHTDMKFMLGKFPELMISHGIQVVIGAGDFIEGLKHDLLTKGEVYGGMSFVYNYTKQEKLAAYLIGLGLLKIFRHNIDPFLKKNGLKSVHQKQLAKAISESLPLFVCIAGNHCEWVAPLGFDPLDTLRSSLKDILSWHIAEMLSEFDVSLYNVQSLVQNKLVMLRQGEKYTLPSGTVISILHPHMSGTKTPSIRPQGMLQKVDSKIVFGANFHTAEAVAEWSMEQGQRICVQFGTVKKRSGFEDTKLKTVDSGVGFLKATSVGGRMRVTETTFYQTSTEDLQKENLKILEDFEKWLKICH